MFRLIGVCILVLVGFTGCGQKPNPESVIVKNAFMYPPVPGSQVGAIYMVLENQTSSPIVVNYIHTTIAGRVEVHQHIHEDGMMKMRQAKHLKIPAKQKQLFEPGGYHLMVFDFYEPITAGSRFTLVIEFEGGQRVEAPVDVRPQG